MNKRKKKLEFSQGLAIAVVIAGILEIAAYYTAIFLGKECDPIIAETATTQCLGAVLSYCLYQFGLKNSRNKYGIDPDGQPYQNVENGKVEDDE